MYKTFKTKIYPNESTKLYIEKCFNARRFSWNWALAKWNEIYKNGSQPAMGQIKKELLKLRNIQFPWLNEVNSMVIENALISLDYAWTQHFKSKFKTPRFKSKYDTRKSFTINRKNDFVFKFCKKTFSIPTVGRKTKQYNNRISIRCAEVISFLNKYKVIKMHIFKENNSYYVAFVYEFAPTYKNNSTENVGIDLGIKTFATQSDGKAIDVPHSIRKTLNQINTIQQKLSKKKVRSNNHKKFSAKVSSKYKKLKNRRRYFLNQYTTWLCKTYKNIVIENLSVSNMIKLRSLSDKVYQNTFSTFRRMLEYKTIFYDSNLIIADRWFPSSKRCCKCGNIKQDLTLKDRVYECPICNNKINRDLNAAINLELLIS